MRERTQFEKELVDLGLREALPASAPQHAFEVGESLAYEARASKPTPEPYTITGGHYLPKEKAHHAQDPDGLLRTSSIVGKEEMKLAGRAPSPILVGRKTWLFEGKKLGKLVQEYNQFTDYFEEVLRAIGRLRDLLSAGAPEAPTDLTSTQKYALRPTDDQRATHEKKDAYTTWRKAQTQYAAADDKGDLTEGRVYDVANTAEEFYSARKAFWQAQDQLQQTIAKSKRLNKPKYETVELKFANIESILEIGEKLVEGTGVAIVVGMADKVLEAGKKRAEYDAKMREFLDSVKDTTAAGPDEFASIGRTNAADHPRAEIFFDSLCRGGRHRFQKPGAELHAMGSIVGPFAGRLEELAGGDHCGMTDDGNGFTLAARLQRRTQKPLPSLWNVTRSTRPAKTSVVGLLFAAIDCPTRLSIFFHIGTGPALIRQ